MTNAKMSGNFLEYIILLQIHEEFSLISNRSITFFDVKVGTRQGDVHGPTLFNFNVASLLYADDLVILSTTANGRRLVLNIIVTLGNYQSI
jgi:hypothetical protein